MDDVVDNTDNTVERQKQALRLVEQLIKLDSDEATTAYALKMRGRLQLPMAAVLDKLWPGIPVAEKSRRLGITREAYYGWKSGAYRPDLKMAKKLAAATGLDLKDIMGKTPRRR